MNFDWATILKELGTSGLILAVLGYWFTFFWKHMGKVHTEHKREYKEISQKSFEVINKNTEGMTRLSESIKDLKERIR